MRRRARRGAALAGTRRRRGRGRSVRAADAGQDQTGAGSPLCGVAGQRRAESKRDRPDRDRRQGQRDDLTVRMPVPVEDLRVSAYVIPTATPESDGTLEWDSTTLVLAELQGGGKKALGYTYAD